LNVQDRWKLKFQYSSSNCQQWEDRAYSAGIALRNIGRVLIAATLFTASPMVLSQQDQASDRKSDLNTDAAKISWLPGENYNLQTGEMGHYMTDLVFEGNGLPITVARTDNTSVNLAPEFKYMALDIPTVTFRNGHTEGSWGNCELLDLLNAYPHKKGNDAANQHSPMVFHLGKSSITFFSVKDYEQPHKPGIDRFPDNADFVSPSNWYIDCVDESDTEASHTSLRVYSPDGMIYTLEKAAGWRHNAYRESGGNQVVKLMSKSSYRATLIQDAYGNSLVYSYEGGLDRNRGVTTSRFPRLLSIHDPADGRRVEFEYDSSRYVSSIKSNGVPNQHVVDYTYPADPTSLSVTYDRTRKIDYMYTRGQLRKITYPKGGTVVYNYDPVKFDATHYQVNADSRGVYGEYDMLISRVVDDLVNSSETSSSGTYRFRFNPSSDQTLSRFVDTPDTTIEYKFGKINKDGRYIAPQNPVTPWQGKLLFVKNYGRVLDDSENLQAAAGQLRPVNEKRYTYKYLENSSVTRSYPPLSDGQDGIQMAGASNVVTTDIVTTVYGTVTRTFTRQFRDHDAYGYPKRIIERSGEGLIRILEVDYKHDFAKWIRGKRSSNRVTGTNGKIYEYQTFGYNDFGSVNRTNNTGVINQIKYFETGYQKGQIENVSDVFGNTHAYAYYYRGIPRKETDPEGREVVREVDSDGTLRVETQKGSGGYVNWSWRYEYDQARRQKTITSPLSISGVRDVSISWPNSRHQKQTRAGVPHDSHTHYDGFGREIFSGTQNGRGLSTWVSVKSAYDAQGRLTFRSYPLNMSNTNLTISILDKGTTYEYDGLSRVIRQEQYAGGAGKDVINRWQYDGMQITQTDGRGHKSVTRYDAYGTPSFDYPVVSEDAKGITTSYSRDPDYRLVRYVRDGQARSYDYNRKRELAARWIPENGSTNFNYYPNGWLQSSTNGNTRTEYTYYRDGQIATEKYTGDGESVYRSFQYDSLGRLYTLSNTTGENRNEWRYGYDGEGKLTSETLQVDGRSYSMRYAYDDLSNLRSITYPNGREYLYDPDGFGRARSLIDTSGDIVYDNITYYPDGRAYRLTRGTHTVINRLDNGQRPWVRQLYRNKDSYYYANQRYEYDEASNVKQIFDTVNPRVSTLTYDPLNRLVYADNNNNDVVTISAFSYNGTDDILAMRQSGTAGTYVYDESTRLLKSITSSKGNREFAYNAQGDIVRHDSLSAEGAITTRTLMRNSAGQIGKLFANDDPNYTMDYAYDGNGRRVSKSRNGTVYTVYGADGKLRFREDTLSGVTSEYLYIAGELIMRRDQGEPVVFSDKPTINPPDTGSNVSNATNFRATAFSSSAAELYWTAAEDEQHGIAKEYAIYRDGQLLQTTESSSSLWLSGMTEDSIHTFQIMAIYSSGAQSEKSDPITLRIAAQQQSY